MAKGKNKRTARKDQKRRKHDKHTFSKKEWFQLISPAAVKKTIPIGWTCCKKPTGTERVQDFLNGRISEMCYGDITGNVKDIPKKLKIITEEVHGKSCVTSFYGFELMRDVIMEKLKKRQSLIEVYQDVKTQDGTIFRVFVMIVTKRSQNQAKLNSYAQHSKIKILRKKIQAELQKKASNMTADAFAHEIIVDLLNGELEKVAGQVLMNCKLLITKVKTVRKGNVDLAALKKEADDIHRQKINKENPEAQNLISKEMQEN